MAEVKGAQRASALELIPMTEAERDASNFADSTVIFVSDGSNPGVQVKVSGSWVRVPNSSQVTFDAQ